MNTILLPILISFINTISFYRSRAKDEFFIDKSKLLEIARKNALSMMKQGTVGTDLNKVTAITAGGKTVDELTGYFAF